MRKYLLNGYIYFILILILYTTSSIYSIVYSSTDSFSKILLIIAIFCLVLFYITKIQLNSKLLIVLLVTVLLFGAHSLLANSSIADVIFFLLRFVSIVIFAYFCNLKKINLFEKLFKLSIVICLIYLALYILFESGVYNFDTIIFNKDYVVGSGSNQVIHKLYYVSNYGIYFKSSKLYLFGFEMSQLCGPFSEPGLYQFLINYGIFYLLFISKKIKVYQALILVVSLLLCGSSMGYICFLIFVVLYFIKKRNPFTLIALLVSIFMVSVAIYYILNYKMNETVSFDSRYSDSIEMITLIFENPLGYGFGNTRLSYNGLLTIMASFGILSLLLLVPLFYSSVKISNGSKVAVISFVLYIIFSLANEPIGFSNYVLLFVSIGMVNLLCKEEQLEVYHENNEIIRQC